jgi:predicted dehydrogenase
LHFEYIEKLSNKGINLFIEKPAIHTLDNCEKLIQLVDEKKIKTYVACNLRFHPCIKYLKNELIRDNLIINEVNVYCGSYLPEWRPGKDFHKIYSANANMGGGVHLDLFHELDYVTWLLGFPSKSSSIKRSVSSLSINSVDYANYNLEYTNFTANIVLNYYRKKAKRTIEFVLDDQIITADLINNIISDENNRVLYKYSDFSLNETYKSQMEYFMKYLGKNEKSLK